MVNLFNLNEFVIIDMETTSFVLDEDVLVQFAARKYRGNKMVDKLNILINNKNINLSDDFKKRTRISYKLLKNKGISLTKARELIRNFISNHTIITYKGNFYYLQMLWFLFDYQLKNPTVDVIDIAKEFKLIKDPDEVSLEDLAISLNLDFNESKWYNASHDVATIEKIWFKLKSLLKERRS